MALPGILPLFPLPNVVLFPQVLLPLHIFEPRYRQMVRDALASDELIGMILLRGLEGDPAGRDVYSIGCAGRIIRKVDLPDGRSNILLQGVREFVAREQHFDKPYRTAAVSWREPEKDFRLGEPLRTRLSGCIRRFVGNEKESEPSLRILSDPAVSDETLVNLFAFALDFPIAEKQALLDAPNAGARAERLVETLEFHNLEREFGSGGEATKQRWQ